MHPDHLRIYSVDLHVERRETLPGVDKRAPHLDPTLRIDAGKADLAYARGIGVGRFHVKRHETERTARKALGDFWGEEQGTLRKVSVRRQATSAIPRLPCRENRFGRFCMHVLPARGRILSLAGADVRPMSNENEGNENSDGR